MEGRSHLSTGVVVETAVVVVVVVVGASVVVRFARLVV